MRIPITRKIKAWKAGRLISNLRCEPFASRLGNQEPKSQDQLVGIIIGLGKGLSSDCLGIMWKEEIEKALWGVSNPAGDRGTAPNRRVFSVLLQRVRTSGESLFRFCFRTQGLQHRCSMIGEKQGYCFSAFRVVCIGWLTSYLRLTKRKQSNGSNVSL